MRKIHLLYLKKKKAFFKKKKKNPLYFSYCNYSVGIVKSVIRLGYLVRFAFLSQSKGL